MFTKFATVMEVDPVQAAAKAKQTPRQGDVWVEHAGTDLAQAA